MVGEMLNPWDLGDVGDVPGAFSLIGFSGGSVILVAETGVVAVGKGDAESTSWIVEAVVVGRKREATRTRLLNELIVLAIIFNYGWQRSEEREGTPAASRHKNSYQAFSSTQHQTRRSKMREIIYVQAGTTANYVGTHFWNDKTTTPLSTPRETNRSESTTQSHSRFERTQIPCVRCP
jgi:hypothetical protein